MKKLLFIAILLLSNFTYSQDPTFVIQYKYATIGKEPSFKKIDVTAVFNYEGTKNVMLYLPGREIYLYRISNITKGKTNKGREYQMFDCIHSENGDKVSLQLFDTALRIFINGEYVEYYE
jgi:hypothetical protein